MLTSVVTEEFAICLAQDAIYCDLCDNPAVRFSNACQTNLCLDCVIRHRDEFESLSHDIVPFKSYCNRNENIIPVKDFRYTVSNAVRYTVNNVVRFGKSDELD